VSTQSPRAVDKSSTGDYFASPAMTSPPGSVGDRPEHAGNGESNIAQMCYTLGHEHDTDCHGLPRIPRKDLVPVRVSVSESVLCLSLAESNIVKVARPRIHRCGAFCAQILSVDHRSVTLSGAKGLISAPDRFFALLRMTDL
jgi:hypothetical protein